MLRKLFNRRKLENRLQKFCQCRPSRRRDDVFQFVQAHSLAIMPVGCVAYSRPVTLEQ